MNERNPETSRLVRWVALLVAAVAVLCTAQPATETATPPTAVPAARQANNVAVITIHGKGGIDRFTSISVMRRIKAAEDGGADALVFDLDTPGGEVGAVLDICNAIKGSKIKNTVAWINPNAYSGGAIIALACREIVISDAASIGDAGVVALNPLGMINSLPEHERQKFLAPVLAEVVDSARRNGYDEKLVQGFVSLGVELWQVENTQTGQRIFIDRDEYRILFDNEPEATDPIIPSAPRRTGDRATSPLPREIHRPRDSMEFIPASPGLAEMATNVTDQIQTPSSRPLITSATKGQWKLLHGGRRVTSGQGFIVLKDKLPIQFGLASSTINTDEQLKQFFGANNLIRLDRTWSETFVKFLNTMPVRGVLIVIFLLGIFIEMVSPGLIAPGSIAAVALIGLLAPPMLVGMASWWEIAAIAVGIALIAIEIFVIPGFGVFGVVGLIALFGGLVGTFAPQGADGLFPDTPGGRDDLLYGVVTIVLASATAGIGMYFISKHLGSLPFFGRLVLQDPEPSEDQRGGELLAAIQQDSGEVSVGATGVAFSPLRPAGKMEYEGRLVDVVADIGYIPRGVQVRVIEVTPFRIAVERVEQGDSPS